jgi:hypothetical protein
MRIAMIQGGPIRRLQQRRLTRRQILDEQGKKTLSEIRVREGTWVSPNPRGSNTGDSRSRRRLTEAGTSERDTAVT